MRNDIFLSISLLGLLLSFGCQPKPASPPSLVPTVQQIEMGSGYLDFSEGINCIVDNPELEALANILSEDYRLLRGESLPKGKATIRLSLNPELKPGEYKMDIDQEVHISGKDAPTVALASASLWQSLTTDFQVPRMSLTDHPAYPYRSVMLDLARAWHSIETLKSIVELCRWYKINYLHLHLTDDSAFSFPSSTFPSLATTGHSYSKEDLVALEKYAYERGVTLVPELDVPGHSSKLVAALPDIFGLQNLDVNPYTINMGKESAYAAIEQLIEEMAAIFVHSPYIHIGGDEVSYEGMAEDPDIQAYIENHELPDLHELFLHFLIRVNESVKKTGKQTIVWAGFGENGELEIPKDVIVLNWEHTHHDPKDLLAKGYPIINASFKPLYVVNNRKWEPQYIYEQWSPNRWESWANKGDFLGEELPTNDQVMGATLCAWEQSQVNQLSRLRHRLASVAQHLWASPPHLSWAEFHNRQQKTNEKLGKLIHPFEVEISGLAHPELGEGNFYEHLWFGDWLSITVNPSFPGTKLQYSLEKEPEDSDWLPLNSPLNLEKSTPLHVRAIDEGNQQIGRTYHQHFFHRPLHVGADGLWEELLPGSWEKLRFEDTLWLTPSSSIPGTTIRYQTDGRAVTPSSKLAQGPIPITETAHFRAQLYGKGDSTIGSPFRESYYKIWHEPSLTTGKPISASNDHVVPNCARPANNGRISLWEMWGDHVDKENWVMVDLENLEEVSRLKVYTFWDNWRYYQYTIEASLDGKDWMELVDFSENKEVATHHGITHLISPTQVRYLKINMLHNSANPGLHLVEFGAFRN